MDALYFRVSSERQTTENQFEDLLQVAEKEGSGRDWGRIREMLSRCVIEEHRPGTSGLARTVYRVDALLEEDLARECVYVEQGRSGKMREVISAVYELADLGITVIPTKSATGPITSTMGTLLGDGELGEIGGHQSRSSSGACGGQAHRPSSGDIRPRSGDPAPRSGTPVLAQDRPPDGAGVGTVVRAYRDRHAPPQPFQKYERMNP